MIPVSAGPVTSAAEARASQRRRAYAYSMAELPFGTFFRNSITATGLVALALWMRAGPIEIGILASFPFLSNAVSVFAPHALAVARSRRRLAIWGYSLMTVFYGALPALVAAGMVAPESLPSLRLLLMVAVALAEMAQALASVGYIAWAAELFAPEERVRFFSWRLSAMSASNIVTALLIGQFLNRWGLGRDIDPVAFLILIPAAMASMAAAVVLISKIPAGHQAELPTDPAGGSPFLLPLRDPGYRRFLVARSLQALTYQIMAPFFAVYMAVDLGLPYGWIFGLQVMYQGMSIVGYRLWERVALRIGARKVFIINGGLFIIYPAIYAFAGLGGLWLLVPLQLYGISEGGYMLSVQVLMLNLAPEKRHVTYLGTANSLVGTLFGISAIAGGLLVAPLAQIPAIRDLSPLQSGIPALLMLAALLRLLVFPGLFLVPELPVRPSESA